MPGHRLAMWVCGYVVYIWGVCGGGGRVRRAHAPQDVLDRLPWSPPRGTSPGDPNFIASVGTSTWASRTRTAPSRSSFGLQPTGFQSPRHRSRSSDQAAPSTLGRTRPPSSILILMRPRLGPSKASGTQVRKDGRSVLRRGRLSKPCSKINQSPSHCRPPPIIHASVLLGWPSSATPGGHQIAPKVCILLPSPVASPEASGAPPLALDRDPRHRLLVLSLAQSSRVGTTGHDIVRDRVCLIHRPWVFRTATRVFLFSS